MTPRSAATQLEHLVHRTSAGASSTLRRKLDRNSSRVQYGVGLFGGDPGDAGAYGAKNTPENGKTLHDSLVMCQPN